DPDALTWMKYLSARGPGLPQLAVHEHEPVVAHLAHGAGDQLRADRDGFVPDLHRFADRKRPRSSQRYREADHQRLRSMKAGGIREEHDRTDREADQAGHGERAV